jgi:hypothetical protein
MKKPTGIKFGILTAALAFILPGHARAGENEEKDEQRIKIECCPKAVRAAGLAAAVTPQTI